jgi:periplasmic divalent cation tolerance protein
MAVTIKTDLAQFDTLEAKIRELHSYEVPEIIALPIVSALNLTCNGFLSK